MHKDPEETLPGHEERIRALEHKVHMLTQLCAELTQRVDLHKTQADTRNYNVMEHLHRIGGVH